MHRNPRQARHNAATARASTRLRADREEGTRRRAWKGERGKRKGRGRTREAATRAYKGWEAATEIAARVNWAARGRRQTWRGVCQQGNEVFQRNQLTLTGFFLKKVRLGQIAEREANKKAQAAQAEFDRARIIEDSVAENRASQEARLAKTESAYKLKCELESQLIEKEQNRQVAYEQFLEEKKLIDDVVNKIKMEDQLRRENEYKRIQEHRQFIGNKEIENEQLKKEQQRQHDEEERRNREFEEEIRQRQAEVKRKRDDKFDNMLKCQAELSEKLTALKTDSSEYDNMIMNLVLAEHEEKEKQKEQDLAEKLIRMRRELREGHHDQMRQKRDRALQDQVYFSYH